MAERNFDEEYNLAGQGGHIFVLNGYEFHTKAIAPPSAFLGEVRGLEAAVNFLLAVLIPEDRDIFSKMVNDPDANMSAFQIDKVASWLIEETSGKPSDAPD